MKTFLGFTTGLLSGLFIGIGITVVVAATDEDFREYINESAERLKQ